MASTKEHGWLTCAPGDPTKLQWDSMIAFAGDREFCAEQWNADTSEVRFRVGTCEYTININGEIRNG